MDIRWIESFEEFFKDMGDRPKGLTLERIDVNGNYTRDNCIWASRRAQSLNTRRTIYLVHEKQRKKLAEWADILGIKHHTLYCRYIRGGDPFKTKRKAAL